MIQWLQKKQNEGGVASAAPAKGAKQNPAGAKKDEKAHHSDSEEKASSDEDDQDDYIDHLPTAKEKGKT